MPTATPQKKAEYTTIFLLKINKFFKKGWDVFEFKESRGKNYSSLKQTKLSDIDQSFE